MAQVTSGNDVTVIVLNAEEAASLTDLLEYTMDEFPQPELDELTSALCGAHPSYTLEVPATNWDKPEPPWKDEPTSDYRVAE